MNEQDNNNNTSEKVFIAQRSTRSPSAMMESGRVCSIYFYSSTNHLGVQKRENKSLK